MNIFFLFSHFTALCAVFAFQENKKHKWNEEEKSKYILEDRDL